jgi:hypothetical protein
MVDFKKLRASKAKPNPIPPGEIFHSLPKPVGINDLPTRRIRGRVPAERPD